MLFHLLDIEDLEETDYPCKCKTGAQQSETPRKDNNTKQCVEDRSNVYRYVVNILANR